MAELKGITLDQAEDIELMEFFNWLVYIKEKDAHDERIIKRSRKHLE